MFSAFRSKRSPSPIATSRPGDVIATNRPGDVSSGMLGAVESWSTVADHGLIAKDCRLLVELEGISKP